jgi:hypothetical protein
VRILYVTNGFPYPLTSGTLRHFHFIRELGGRHDIVLMSLVGATHRPADREALAAHVRRIETFASSARRRAFGPRVRSRLERFAGLGDPAARALRRAATRVIAEERPDVVLFSGKRAEAAVSAFDRLPMVVDLCDATSLRLRGQVMTAAWPRRPQVALAWWTARRAERSLIGRATHLLFASRRDLEALVRSPDLDRCTILPNGVDVSYWQRSGLRLGRDVVFTGRMDYAPNADAAMYLVRAIMPLVRTSLPDASVSIVGADPPPAVRGLASRSWVTVTGFVDDMRPHLEGAAVFACPLRFGAGIQNKVLEAMAMEVPVVTTSIAADGLRVDGPSPPPLVVADDPAGFARHLVRALEHAASGGPPDVAARAFVARNFDWATNAARLEAILAAARR